MKERIAILGAGESGTGAALLAKAKGYDVFVSDFGKISTEYKEILQSACIAFEEGQHTQSEILTAVEVVKSPGIPDSADLVQKCLSKQIPVISELEFASKYTCAKLIAITGTNGKTTTTLLTYHLLKEAGLKVGLAGNIGESFAKQVIDDAFDYFVIEVSSFQLDGMYKFKADIAILLNITPDHLDRYAFQFENYINSKFRIVQNMREHDVFIYYAQDEVLKDEVSSRNIHAQKRQISLNEKVELGACAIGDAIFCRFSESKGYSLKKSDLPLKGEHNLINTMSAVMAAGLSGLDEKDIKEGLKTFQNAEHRLEFVKEINGVTFVNDSKATNVDAAFYALGSFDNSVVWIAGGKDKGNDYAVLETVVSENVKAMVCLGVDNSKLKKAFENIIKDIAETTDVNEAVVKAYALAEKGDTVLLSPACASFDLFKNYEDRGHQFKAAVETLGEKN